MLRKCTVLSSWSSRNKHKNHEERRSTQREDKEAAVNFAKSGENRNKTNDIGTEPVKSIFANVRLRCDQALQINQVKNRVLPTRSVCESINESSNRSFISPAEIFLPADKVCTEKNRIRKPVLKRCHSSTSSDPQEDPICCPTFTAYISSILGILFLIIIVLTVILVMKQKVVIVAKITNAPTAFTSLIPSQYVVGPSALPSSLLNINPRHVPSVTVVPSYPPTPPLEWVKMGNIYGFADGESVGRFVTIANEGNRICVGGLGVVRIYGHTSEGSWSLESDFSNYVEVFDFVISMSLDGKNILLGLRNVGSIRQGAVLVLHEDNSNGWAERATVQGEEERGLFG